jgi:hypothetical protein
LNAELERERHIESGHPADDEPFVEPRRAPARTARAASVEPRTPADDTPVSSRPAIRWRGASRT